METVLEEASARNGRRSRVLNRRIMMDVYFGWGDVGQFVLDLIWKREGEK